MRGKGRIPQHAANDAPLHQAVACRGILGKLPKALAVLHQMPQAIQLPTRLPLEEHPAGLFGSAQALCELRGAKQISAATGRRLYRFLSHAVAYG